MRLLAKLLGTLVVLVVLSLAVAVILVHTKAPEPVEAKDVFGLTALARIPPPKLPELFRFEARDGTKLPYRLYAADAEPTLIFIHGSSYHGGGYHMLAQAVKWEGAANVVLPNMRGHYRSGERSGDVDYVGQMEDDIADLIDALIREGHSGPFLLGGHSSGGGFVIRFAAGPHADKVDRYLLIAPAIPGTPTLRADNGWTTLHTKRLVGLLILNAAGIHSYDHLDILRFNKPANLIDRTETMSYSHRLNVSYHPRFPPNRDLAKLPDTTLMLIGAKDEAIDAEALADYFSEAAPQVKTQVFPHINHIMVAYDSGVFVQILRWIRGES